MNQKYFIDDSCKYMEIGVLIEGLLKLGISSANEQEAQSLIADKCIYIIKDIDSGISKYHQYMRSTKQVSQWILLALCQEMPAQHKIDIFTNDFRRDAKDINVVIGVTDLNKSLETLTRLLSLSISKSDMEVLIVSRREGVGRRSIEKILRAKNPLLNTRVGRLNEYIEHNLSAKWIIIVGNNKHDFAAFEPPKDGYYRVMFIVNKADESPVSFIQAEKTKREIIDVINMLGWNLSYSFSNFYIMSALYEQFNYLLSQDEISEFELRLDERFFIWDEFGLPQHNDTYSLENIKEFLCKFNMFEKINKEIRGISV